MLEALREAMAAEADPERAQQMAAYMKGHFAFLGVGQPARKRAQRAWVGSTRGWDADALIGAARACWEQPEREFQYVACDLLRARVRWLRASDLPALRVLVVHKAWWDTVDALAANVVGPMVRAHPELVADMDAWIVHDDLWLNRAALLHQLKAKDATDPERLFRYATLHVGDARFFLRKGIGWALREHAKRDPDAVRAWVAAHDGVVSGLTRREALKHL
jgi:3-methyladenine DNA glycosylase AlkD